MVMEVAVAPQAATVGPLATSGVNKASTSNVHVEVYSTSSCGRDAPTVLVGNASLYTKGEDKWLMSEANWPTPESSQRGRERAKAAVVAPTVTSGIDQLKNFTDSVHNGKLMDFDEERAASQMSASMESITGANTARTAPAAVGGDSSNGSRARTPLKGYSASSVHDPPRPLGKDAPEPLKYHVLAIMDGHNGHEAPEYLMHTLRRLIHSRLPAVHTIPIKGTPAFTRFLTDIRSAIARAIVVAERNFAAAAHLSGSTVTICVLVDWVLTVVNLGDSTCFLDTGHAVVQLSEDHNLEASPKEVQRLREAGVRVAKLSVNLDGPAAKEGEGLGPLRCWPGGLCLSRTFGDFDAPNSLISAPLVKQVLLPERGARIILASDGLWAIHPPSGTAAIEVIRKARGYDVNKAAGYLVNKAKLSFGLKDDVSVIVVDVLPRDVRSFSNLCADRPKAGGGGGFGCFRPPMVDIDEMDPRMTRSSAIEPLATVDYGCPPSNNPEAVALRNELVQCKNASYDVFRLAVQLKKQGQNPLKSEKIQEMCRHISL